MRDILRNGPKFEIILKFSMENTLNSRKQGKTLSSWVDRKQLFIFQMSIIKLSYWIMPFKLARILVAHDGGKLSQVGELSIAERLQGR